MRTLLTLTFAGGIMATTGLAQEQVRPEPPVVVTQGEGVVRLAPDQAFVRIAAEARAKDPKSAQSTNAASMAAVQQKLAGSGIAKDAIRTVTVSLQQEFDYHEGRQTPRGYLARNVIEVRVDDLARLGEVMDASVGSGATSIQGLRFDLKEREASEREALKRAVADALARADAAASGAGRTVERVIRIAEAGPVAISRPETAMFSRAAADTAQATPIAEGEIEIRAQVTVTAVIK